MSQVTSQSELTTKEIVEQTIQDYHKQILPYLNGSFPTPIVNKFDKANMYSTDEQIVGRWIDGKPLYQKTVHITNVSSDNIELISSGIEYAKLVDVEYVTSGGMIQTGNWWYSSSDYINLRIVCNDVGKIILTILQSRNPVSEVYATIQYTKTTDTAMNIGSDTDYSTNEKIIGTWIDGKPLYQITVELNYNKANVNEKNFDNVLPDGIENVVECISNYETTDDFNKTITSALPKLDNYSASVYWTSNMPKGLIVCLGDTEKARVNKIYATVKYTKTTD